MACAPPPTIIGCARQRHHDRFPASIRLGADVRRAAEVVCVSDVGQLMVVDHNGAFVRSLSEEELVGRGERAGTELPAALRGALDAVGA